MKKFKRRNFQQGKLNILEFELLKFANSIGLEVRQKIKNTKHALENYCRALQKGRRPTEKGFFSYGVYLSLEPIFHFILFHIKENGCDKKFIHAEGKLLFKGPCCESMGLKKGTYFPLKNCSELGEKQSETNLNLKYNTSRFY